MDNAPATASTELPSAWIDRLFDRLLAMYGRKFADMWGCVPIDSLKATWAAGLVDMTGTEIAAGISGCMTREWPPTLPEFRALCRECAAVSHETAFVEATKRYGTREGWSDPAIYWAAAAIGGDVHRLPYSVLKDRWIDALNRARRNPQPIPPPVPRDQHLAPPSSLTPEQEREQSLETAARVMAYWRELQNRNANIPAVPEHLREPGQDDEEAAA